MIKQVTDILIDGPHISANELAKYTFSSISEKKEILRNQKFPPAYQISYYARALKGIRDSFRNGIYEENALIQSTDKIRNLPVKNRQEAVRNKCNIDAIDSFRKMRQLAMPPVGDHQFIHRNAHFIREGVKISVRPEIVTSNLKGSFFCYTKLRFSKDKYSADASEIVLLLLLIYGQQRNDQRVRFDLDKTKLIDCFGQAVIEGHRIPDYRQQQLDKALKEIVSIWDQITPRK